MATRQENGLSLEAASAISAYRRLTLDSDGKVAHAGATDFSIGYSRHDAAAADFVTIDQPGRMAKILVAANVAITLGDALYPAAAGRVTGISTGLRQIGVCNLAATAQDDIIEMIPVETSAYHS